jgi:mRNA (guanine-N7-)-methyltransferase
MPTFGFRYWFWLKDAVENVPEYIVHWDHFVRYVPLTSLSVIADPSFRLASEYNLELKYHKEFHDIFAEFSDHSEFGPLMQRMKVVNPDGESQMDELQWEAASEFLASSPLN